MQGDTDAAARRDIDERLDAELADSFPASDPPSISQPGALAVESPRRGSRLRRGRAVVFLSDVLSIGGLLMRRLLHGQRPS